jgi:DNA-binding transcriptional LysR family regulator
MQNRIKNERVASVLTQGNASAFDWALMPSFLAVLDAGSLLAASRQLQQSQPTLGRHIASLETQLGAALFERTGRGLTPTALARQIAEHARAMQDAADSLQRSLSKSGEVLSGTVRLTASQTVAAYLLPPILTKMRQVLPEIQIEVVSSNDVKNLLRREADIALRMVRPEQDSLIARKVASIGLGTYAHVNYLKKKGEPRVPRELLSHELIGYDLTSTIVQGFRAFGEPVSREQFSLRSDDHILHWQAVRAAFGIGFISHYLAKTDRRVKRILPKLQIADLPVWLTTHREIHGNPRIRRVYDFLADNIAAALTDTEA